VALAVALSLPLALVALLLGLAYLPEKRSLNNRFDLVGALLLTGTALVSLAWYLNPGLMGLGALGLLLAITFLVHQRRARWPILPLMLFRDSRFDYALFASVIAFIGQSSVFITLPLVFQQTMGYSPLLAAALFIPWPIMTAIIGPWAGRYADENNPRVVASAGLAIFSLGLAALATLPSNALPVDIVWRTAICGVGFGLFQSPNNREILTHALPMHAAGAAALLSTARLLGQALGAIMVGMVYAKVQPSQAAQQGASDALGLLWYASALQILSLAVGASMWVVSRTIGSKSAPQS
jgi:DHA2 family multidrug resistance protein-like MFS transporter